MTKYLNQVQRVFLAASMMAPAISATAQAEDRVLHSFERKQLSDVYYSEGANAADINGDGQADVVYGPYWFAGPAFEKKHELYPAKPQNREGYADNFFNWIYDFNGDGWNDVFVVGFPGTASSISGNASSTPDRTSWHWSLPDPTPPPSRRLWSASIICVCSRAGQSEFLAFAP